MRPVPESLVNSASSMPTLRNRHSTASEWPVAIAIKGMLPSLLLRGRRVWFLSVSAADVQAVTLGMVICRRHLPVCMTSGMFAPDGTPFSENRPCASVSATAIGCPDTYESHLSHAAPEVIGDSVVLGT